MVSRRRTLKRLGLGALVSAASTAGCTGRGSTGDRPDLESNPRADSLPDRQHAWDATLRTDQTGNTLSPQFHRVLLLDLDAEQSADAAETVERAMRSVEAAYEWGPAGVLHALAWGTAYFERRSALEESPIRSPKVLSRTDDPKLLDFDAALVLASDVPSHLAAVESAMFDGAPRMNGESVEHRLGDVFSRAGRRTGFIGDGLPAEHTDAEGVPDDASLGSDDPMFMGFFSGRDGTQASEDRVTIGSGRFAGGTTMHVSHLHQSLDRWFDGLDDQSRVSRMFGPGFSTDDVDSLGETVPFEDAVQRHAREEGVVGHHEKVARVRRDNRPLILRRDFNTVDGGRAGVHFVSLQRSLDHFESTRKSMNGWYLRDDNPEVTDRRNNGILNFISVQSRVNFYVPPREIRAFPLL